MRRMNDLESSLRWQPAPARLGRQAGIRPLLCVTALVWAAVWGAAGAGAAGAKKTYDVHFRVYCEPAANFGGDLCFAGSGWTSESDIRDAYQRVVMPVLNLVYRPAKVSFRLHDVTYDETRPDFAAVTAAANDHHNCPHPNNEKAVKEMRELAAQPENAERVTVFALPRACQGWSAIPPEAKPAERFAVFASVRLDADPFFLPHEMGHHFCLAHTFTFKDAAPGTTCGAANHDGDGLQDTPPDPSVVERVRFSDWFAAAVSGDESLLKKYAAESDLIVPDADWDLGVHPNYVNASPMACHEWCDWAELPADSPLNPTLNQVGMAARFCWPLCYRAAPLPVSVPGAYPGKPPHMENVLSYYFRRCTGPLTVGGKPREALVKGQVDRIWSCIQTVAERADYIDVCAKRGGDTDSDGICDLDDGCPTVFNADGLDTDGDGTPDACDLCPNDPQPEAVDTDGDGLGDLCDPNDDNDACDDAVDQHPKDAEVKVGTAFSPDCDPESRPILASESGDADGDGIPDCQETDDDDDGIPDEDDPCPLIQGTEGCDTLDLTCRIPKPWQLACLGPSCDPIFSLVLVSLVSPEEEVVFHGFQIRGDRVYVVPRPGVTLGESLDYLLGGGFSAGPDGEAPLLRLEIRPRDGAGSVSIIDAFRGADLAVSWDHPGRVLLLDLAEPSRVAVSRAWGAGLGPVEPLADADGDGLPDVADNCTARPNSGQLDLDGDGFGDACDLDFDNDGIVTAGDVARVEGCVGVELEPRIHLYEQGEDRITEPSSLAALTRQARCARADLDGDGEVDEADLRLAKSGLGRPPGPSGRALATAPPPDGPGFPPWALLLLLLLVLVLLAYWLRARLGRAA